MMLYQCMKCKRKYPLSMARGRTIMCCGTPAVKVMDLSDKPNFSKYPKKK
jgi:hypothetical protein